MNIWGLERRLRSARDMLKNLEKELEQLMKRKRRKREEWDKIEKLESRLKGIGRGMNNLRNKIKLLKNEKKQKKK